MSRSRESRGRAAARAPGDEHRRADRVAAEIQRVLAELLQRRTKDPRLADVTITAVRLTPDLRIARVFFTLLGSQGDHTAAQAGLEHALPFLRRGVAEGLSLRYAPDLVFAYDETLESARRIDSLLHDLHGAPGTGVNEAAPQDEPDDSGKKR